MQFIVEYFTLTGTLRITLQASTYKQIEVTAAEEAEKRDGVLGIRCIREIPLLLAS